MREVSGDILERGRRSHCREVRSILDDRGTGRRGPFYVLNEAHARLCVDAVEKIGYGEEVDADSLAALAISYHALTNRLDKPGILDTRMVERGWRDSLMFALAFGAGQVAERNNALRWRVALPLLEKPLAIDELDIID